MRDVIVQGVKKAPAELAKTATHLLPLAIQSIHLAANIVKSEISSSTLNKSADDQLTKASLDYYLANKNSMSFADYLALDAMTTNYYKGLNMMAWWETGDFLQLNRAVINSTLPDELKVQLVQLGIEDTQEGFAGIMREGSNLIYFLSTAALFPNVGLGPKGSLLKFRTLPQVSKQIPMTVHGAERIAGIGATRGGVLSILEIKLTKNLGKSFVQADGATVYLHEMTPGRFNGVVEGSRGLITTMKKWSQKSIDKIAKKYGWKLK